MGFIQWIASMFTYDGPAPFFPVQEYDQEPSSTVSDLVRERGIPLMLSYPAQTLRADN